MPDQPGAKAAPPGGRPLLIAFFTIFLDLLGFGIIIPIQAFYAQSFGASPKVVTLLGASYSLMQFIFAPFWGRLSDRIGRRPIVLISIAISIVGHLIFGLAGSLAVLFAARMLIGFGNANLGTAQAIVSDVTTPETRAKGMGVMGAAFGLGFIFGPAIGGLLGQISPTAPAFASAGLAVVNLVMAATLLPETRRPGAAVSGHLRRSVFSFASFRHAMRHVNVGSLLVMGFVITIGFAMMEQTIGLLIEKIWLVDQMLDPSERIKAATRLTAMYLVVVGITATIVQGGLIGRLQKRFGEVTLTRFGAATLALGMVVTPVLVEARVMPVMMISAVLLAVSSGLLNPSSTALLSRSVHSDEQGGVLGLAQSMSALGRVFGPGMAGLIFEAAHGLPFYTAGALIGVGALLSLTLKPPPAAAAGGAVAAAH